jgi:hypothetical protein
MIKTDDVYMLFVCSPSGDNSPTLIASVKAGDSGSILSGVSSEDLYETETPLSAFGFLALALPEYDLLTRSALLVMIK